MSQAGWRLRSGCDSDRPVMEAFGLYREVTLDTVQEVTSEFGPDEDLSGPGRWS